MFTEAENNLMRARVRDELDALRAHDEREGKPCTLSDSQLALAFELFNDQPLGVQHICARFGISEKTLYKCMKLARDKRDKEEIYP
jgi:hypothetical protein